MRSAGAAASLRARAGRCMLSLKAPWPGAPEWQTPVLMIRLRAAPVRAPGTPTRKIGTAVFGLKHVSSRLLAVRFFYILVFFFYFSQIDFWTKDFRK